jgi:hypothetical protein
LSEIWPPARRKFFAEPDLVAMIATLAKLQLESDWCVSDEGTQGGNISSIGRSRIVQVIKRSAFYKAAELYEVLVPEMATNTRSAGPNGSLPTRDADPVLIRRVSLSCFCAIVRF